MWRECHPNIPAHQALRLQVETSHGRRPDRDWVRSSGRPRNRWIDQLRQDHHRPPADLVVTLERRYGPRRLRDDDDDFRIHRLNYNLLLLLYMHL